MDWIKPTAEAAPNPLVSNCYFMIEMCLEMTIGKSKKKWFSSDESDNRDSDPMDNNCYDNSADEGSQESFEPYQPGHLGWDRVEEEVCFFSLW
jgi:hypothetical protein